MGDTARTILLVDDDEDYARFLHRIIKRDHGAARVDVVHDEASARAALAAQRYDYVFSDYDLKSGNGLNVCEVALRNAPATRRIVVTSTPDHVRSKTSAADVAETVWDKSWTPEAIRTAMSAILEASR